MLKVNRKCHVCFKVSGALCCSRCRSAYYCGRDCQKKDWTEGHKTSCTQTRPQPESTVYQAKRTLSYREDDQVVVWCACTATTDKIDVSSKGNNTISFHLLIKNFSGTSIKIAKSILLTVQNETRRRKPLSAIVEEKNGKAISTDNNTNNTNNNNAELQKSDSFLILEKDESVVLRVEFELQALKNLVTPVTTITQALQICNLLEVPIKAEHKGLFNLSLNLE